MIKIQDFTDRCPKCRANLVGGEIPKEQRHLYGGKYFYRHTGIYDMALDRTVAYQCPDCGHQWSPGEHPVG